MPISLDFDAPYDYNQSADGISLPVTLGMGAQSVELSAKLDTGPRIASLRTSAVPNDFWILCSV
jgi:hypothetical protein